MQSSATNIFRRSITPAILAVLALGVAAWAQRWLTDLSVPLDGKIGYIVAIVLFVMALRRNPLQLLLSATQGDTSQSVTSIITGRWRGWLFRASAVFFALAYLTFGESRGCATTINYCFTTVNTSLWLLALGSFLVAAWDWSTASPAQAWERVRGFRLSIGWTGLALVGIMAVAAFFLFYRLPTIPAEPTSDHAEKLYDVYDVLSGQRPVFMTRNTGREWFQFYWTAAWMTLFNMPLNHMALKFGTSLISFLTLPFVFLLGREIAGRNVGLLAMFLTAVSKWHVAITRVGLRFPFTAAFSTATIFFVLRGLRLNRRNDWLLAGLFLGFGLQTYTSVRIVPLLVVALLGLRLVNDIVATPGGARVFWGQIKAGLSQFVPLSIQWRRSSPVGIVAAPPVANAATPAAPTSGGATQARPLALTRAYWVNVACMIVVAVLAFLPTLRFSLEQSTLFWFRSLTRAATLETGQRFNPVERFVGNVWNAALQFNYKGDNVWVNTIPNDPQLDPLSGALFVLGFVYVLLVTMGMVRLPGGRKIGIFSERRFVGAALLVALFVMLLPSILTLAFPIENPSVVRGGGAVPFVMILVALPLVLIMQQVQTSLRSWGQAASLVLLATVLLTVTVLNYRSYFETYDYQLRRTAQNATEIADVLGGFTKSVGDINHAWVVAYANWVDTRNVFLQMGYNTRNNYVPVGQAPNFLQAHVGDPAPKMYILNLADQANLQVLRGLFPQGQVYTYQSRTGPEKDFNVFFVPGASAPAPPQ